MAATYRFYLAARLGDGTTRKTAFRSKLSEYIINDGSKDFWNWNNRTTPHTFCFAFCDSALHATIEADPDIEALSPELADMDAVNAWLDEIAVVSPHINAAGVPVDWKVKPTNRELWRFISAWHVIHQRLPGEEKPLIENSREIIKRDNIPLLGFGPVEF